MRYFLLSRDIPDEVISYIQSTVKTGGIRVAYIITAAQVYPPGQAWLLDPQRQLERHGMIVEQIDIMMLHKESQNIGAVLSDYDVIFVSGGNVFYLNYWMQRVGFASVLKKLDDKIYVGASAGAVCLMKDISGYDIIDDPTKAPARVDKSLGIIDFAVLPHWGNPKYVEKLQDVKRYYESKGLKVEPIADDEYVDLTI